jgi:hypothetical protein
LIFIASREKWNHPLTLPSAFLYDFNWFLRRGVTTTFYEDYRLSRTQDGERKSNVGNFQSGIKPTQQSTINIEDDSQNIK